MLVCLQEAGFSNVNLICEKVSFEGVTRFEDKYRLPMGISVNQSGAGMPLSPLWQSMFECTVAAHCNMGCGHLRRAC